MQAAPRTARVFPPSEIRLERLRHRVALAEVARVSGIPHARVSIVERNPDLARPGEIEKLRAGIELAAEVAGRP